MEREIKFRGFNCGKWYYGDLEYNKRDNVARIHTYKTDGSYDGQYLVAPDTIGQFTGLYDKNDKEIYEGDIIREVDSARAFEVTFQAPEFCMADNTFGYRFLNHPENFEVIGNIHNNKEKV